MILICILIFIFIIFISHTYYGSSDNGMFEMKIIKFSELKDVEDKGFTIVDNITDNLITIKKLVKPAYDDTQIYHFPFLKYYIRPSELIPIYKSLKSEGFNLTVYTNLDDVYDDIKNVIIKKDIDSDYLFKGFGLNAYVTIKIDTTYTFLKIVDYFQEYNRFICRRNNKKDNFLEVFEKNKKTIQKNTKPYTEWSIKNYILKEMRYVPCSEFSPVWYVSVIKFFQQYMNIENVLDMSVGRGSRMIAAASMGLNYVGTDPNETTNKTCNLMRDFFKLVDPSIKATCITSGFEENWEKDLVLPEFDIMFTSPPYFDLELFVEQDGKVGENQSIIKFKTLEEWLEGFLKQCIEKSGRLIRSGGIVALNIDNSFDTKQKDDYINPMLKFKFNDLVYIGNLTLYKKTANYYTVWCWQKK